ncbi:hypothetical protein JH26_25655 [Microvirga sp. BSC39]|nr:hypothetical protein JH26_25655 [Microvirga sp. BSC39]
MRNGYRISGGVMLRDNQPKKLKTFAELNAEIARLEAQGERKANELLVERSYETYERRLNTAWQDPPTFPQPAPHTPPVGQENTQQAYEHRISNAWKESR